MAIARSQFVTATILSGSSLSVVFSSAVTAGNTIIVLGGCFSDATHPLVSTVLDNVNASTNYTRRMVSTMTADTNVHLLLWDKLNISSGAGASTFRVNSSVTGSMQFSICAIEYSGGPITFGSTISANGTSSGASAGALTASSSPALFISGAANNSSATFASTATGGGAVYVATIDPTNANQILNVVEAVAPSSLQENIGHSVNTSTRWLAGSVVYMGLGGVAAEIGHVWSFGLTGVQ